MKFVLPDFLEKNHTLNKLENLSICKYIQYEEQHKNEVFISTNMLIFVIKGSKILHFKDEKIGIVYPVYAGEAPKIILEFLEKATFETDYFYLILTYGKDVTDAPECIARLLEEKGRHVNYIHSILMVDNYLPSFDMNEQRAMNKNVEQQIQQALQDIQNKKEEIPEATQAGRDFHASAKEIFAKNPEIINGEQITVTDKCVGCGICTKVCPRGLFYVEDKKAKRKQNTCEFCLACAQNCPSKAIITKLKDANPNARYRHEKVSLKDIIEANQQV